jgi:CHAT domain-containing protein
MSPGGRIFSQQNLIIMPASLQEQTAQIMYAIDFNGQLSAIWLLTPEEATKYKFSKLDAEEKKKQEDEERKKREEEEKKKKDAAESNS